MRTLLLCMTVFVTPAIAEPTQAQIDAAWHIVAQWDAICQGPAYDTPKYKKACEKYQDALDILNEASGGEE